MRRTGSVFYRAMLFFIVSFILLSSSDALSKRDAMLSVSSEKRSVVIGEEFTITYTVTVEDPDKFKLHRAPIFRGFTVVSEKKRTTVKMISGTAYTSFIFRYTIKANKAGRLKTGRATFIYGRVTYTTAPVEIRASESVLDKLMAKPKPKPKPKVVKKAKPKPKVVKKAKPKPKVVKKKPDYKPGPLKVASELLIKEDARHLALKAPLKATEPEQKPKPKPKPKPKVAKKPKPEPEPEVEKEPEYKPSPPKAVSELLIKDDARRMAWKKLPEKSESKPKPKVVKKPEEKPKPKPKPEPKIVKEPEYKPGPVKVVSELLIKDDIRRKVGERSKPKREKKREVVGEPKVKPKPKPTVAKKPKAKPVRKAKVEYPKKPGSLFVLASVNKHNPFVGEGIVYTFKIYHKIDYFGSLAFTPPEFTGFFVEELPQSRSSENIKKLGGEYIIEEVNYALYPIVPGDISIEGALLEYKEPNGKERRTEPNSVDVMIRKLPAYEDQYDTPFSGSVGVFKMHQRLDVNEALLNEPFTLNITVRGRGNIVGITEPRFNNIDDFSYILIETSENIITEFDGISGGREFTYSLSAKRTGKLKFAGMSFVYFDPAKKEYIETRTNSLAVNVSTGNETERPVESRTGELVSMLAPIRVGMKIGRGYKFYNSRTYIYLMVILLLSSLTVLSFSFKRVYETRNKDIIKRKKSTKTALTSVKEAHLHLNTKEIEDFYNKVHALLNRFYIDRYDFDLITHPLDSVVEVIDGSKNEKRAISDLNDKVRLLNYFRYSSKGEITSDELKAFLVDLKKNLRVIQKCDA